MNFMQTAKTFAKWLLISATLGIILGLIGTAFHILIEYATEFRTKYPVTIAFLPVGGIMIVLLYKLTGMEKDKGTNIVLQSVRSREELPPLRQAPLIFISTVITHLFGGSAGREGAALQLGGSIGNYVGKKLKLDEHDARIITMCGMSAAFSALFGTPLTAAIFSMEVVSVGIMYYAAIVPCVISALAGCYISSVFGIAPTAFTVLNVPTLDPISILQSVLLGILCALLSGVFCFALHKTAYLYNKYIPNRIVEIIAGGAIVAALTFALRTFDYNGAGMNVIENAINGNVRPEAFLLKIIFTALTLGAGYKGGEIVPTLFVGATFGGIAAPLFGMSASFGAAAGMTALFCGVTNCPLSSILLSIELFGAKGLPLFGAVIAVSYMLSGYTGLYSAQKIVYSKMKTKFVDKKTI